MESYWSETFARLLEKYRRDDGSRWTGAAIERATGRRVGRHYVSDLLLGRIQEPSFRKIYYISKAIGAPVEEWMEPPELP